MRRFTFEKGKKRDIIWGIILLLGAVAVLLSSMGYLGGLSFWPTLFSIILAALFVEGIIKRGIGQILFSAAFFVIVNDELLHLEAITPWPVLGAALLGSIGLRMLFPKWRGKYRFIMKGHRGIVEESHNGDKVSYENVFGSTVKYVTGEVGRVEVENAFGSMEIYFSDAVLREGSARVRVESSFGSVSLYVPSSWRIVQDVDTSFGSAEADENGLAGGREAEETGSAGEKNTLYVEGEVTFGTLMIQYI